MVRYRKSSLSKDEYCEGQHGFEHWYLDNHYHTVGYLKVGENRGEMMRRIHGSVGQVHFREATQGR